MSKPRLTRRASATTEGNEAGHSDTPRAKRAQVKKACKRCRSLQKGCSPDRPCLRCSRAGLECVDEGFSAGYETTVIHSPFAATQPFIDLPITSPQSFTGVQNAGETFQRTTNLLSSNLLAFCRQRYTDRLYPTLPLLEQAHLDGLQASLDGPHPSIEAYCLLSALCAHVLLVLGDEGAPNTPDSTPQPHTSRGKMLLSEAQLARDHLQRRPSSTSIEMVLAVFWIYNCESALSHHALAFYFLREATTLFLMLKTERWNSGSASQVLTTRLFWVLLITERSHALRYRRPVTLAITSDTIEIDHSAEGLRSLAALFRPLSTAFIALLNEEEQEDERPTGMLAQIEKLLASAIQSQNALHETQKPNLRVTQLWLQIILWQLRLRLGHLVEHSRHDSLTYHYPLNVAKDVMLSTQDLAIHSIRVHGVGLTEKCFDIACALVDVIARIPLDEAGSGNMVVDPAKSLQYVKSLIVQLPGGEMYDSLLSKHMQQTSPIAVI